MTLYLILLKIALKMLSFNRAEPGQNNNRILIQYCQRAISDFYFNKKCRFKGSR